VLRYALLTNLPESKDSEFTWQDFQTKNNSELVGILGNFVNRALVLTQKHFDNKVPAKGALNEDDLQVVRALVDCARQVADALNAYRFREATQFMMNLARVGNKYLADTEPWKLAKTDLPRVGTILNLAMQVAANLSIIAEPFLPFTALKLRTMLGAGELEWKHAGSADLVQAGQSLGEVKLLFEKIEDDVIAKQIEKLEDKKRSATAEAAPVEPLKPEIAIDDFGKLDIRIGTVVAAEKMPKSDKLLKLTVNSGLDKRTILSGIAKHYAPEDLIGKQVTFIANLAPRKMMGLESNGMILMAEDKDGKLRLIRPVDEVAPGSKVS
jgi:methionyl-tRNA synthetase